MKTDGLICFLSYTSFTFMWLGANLLFFGAFADLIHEHNELIRKKAIEEYIESEDESDDESEDE